MDLRVSRRLPKTVYAPFLALPLVVVLAGCDVSLGKLMGRATEEWTHTYPLAEGGEVRIGNTNGRIEVEAVDGSTVEVRAEKIARAATDSGASELLPRIKIKEEISSDRVSVETERMGFGPRESLGWTSETSPHALSALGAGLST